MVSLKEISHTVSLGGFVASLGVLASSVFVSNAAVASLSTLSGTVSLYAYVGYERQDDRKRLKADLEATSATLNQAEKELRTVEHDKSLLESQLKTLQDQLTAFQKDLQQLESVRRERDALLNVEAKYEILQEDYKRLDAEQSQDNIELETLRFQRQELQSQLQHSKNESEQLKSDLDRVNAENVSLHHENLEFKARFSSADELAKLRADKEASELRDAIATLRKTYDQKMAEYLTLAEKHNELIGVHDSALIDLKGKFSYLTGEGFQEVQQEFNAELSDRDRMLITASARISELEAPHYFDEIGEFIRPNRLIKMLWESEQPICLDASEIVPYSDGTGFDVFFSLRDRKIRGQATIDALTHRGNEFSVLCGCIKDLKFEYDRTNPHRIKSAMVFRKPTKTDSKATIDKLWIPADQFAMKVPKLLKKPMSRIMGSTGEGKGVLVNLLLAVEANQAVPALIRLHDPMDGSVEDHWNIPKASKGAAQSLKAIKAFIAEFDHRVENAISQPKTLDVFDEIDILADRDGSINKSLLNCAKGMRHNGMQAYLMGQSPSVGKKGLEWADFDNFNCVYLGASIITAIDKTPALESKKESLRKEHDKLKDYCDRQNEELGLEGWNEYRVGFIVTGGRAYFFELPNADSILCDWSKLTQQPTEASKTLDSVKSSFDCPECSSSNTKDRSGRKKLANSLTRYYRVCSDCQHKFEVDL